MYSYMLSPKKINIKQRKWCRYKIRVIYNLVLVVYQN
jgi:hypothetical protein